MLEFWKDLSFCCLLLFYMFTMSLYVLVFSCCYIMPNQTNNDNYKYKYNYNYNENYISIHNNSRYWSKNFGCDNDSILKT